ncbi:mitochondrial outer membrane import complex protein METAXIN isoform X2 [Hevea brasiliensis]|uniref:mitochondrial outer membrane import complex protein METAXIN isoform X2 n=1 Tax=Hevea brasiliensis TaxID=3981 RepID=UPI0025F797CD|nr:mitochondrial outer membrane import complex protein METAXIN isoform X2 [Hevea brasiliensis]
MEESHEREECTLVARKPCFGLPTACPICLPVYIYLKLARLPFRLDFNSTYPDSDQIPYVESGAYVAYNNESGGVIQRLKEDGIVNLDTEFCSIPEWISMKAMISSWLVDAVMYELWLGSDGSSAFKIYYSDLPWLIGKVLFVKQAYTVKQQLGITKENAERREEEIYKRVKIAYGALSTRLGEQEFLFEDRPSSLDALFLGHLLFTLQALPEASVLQSSLLEHGNLIRYAEKHKTDFLDAGSSCSAVPWFPSDSSSSTPRRSPSNSSEIFFNFWTCIFLFNVVLQILVQSLRENPRGKRQKRRKLSKEGQNISWQHRW